MTDKLLLFAAMTIIRELQWNADASCDRCMLCGGYKDDGGHSKECPIPEFIGGAKKSLDDNEPDSLDCSRPHF